MKSLREIIGHWFRQDDPGHQTVTGFDFTKDEPLRPLRAVRAKCIECQNGNINEVRNCRMADCSLWPYRRGRRPRPEDLVIAECSDKTTV